MKEKLGMLILAAGASRRMGSPKQLLTWKNKSLLQHSLEAAKGVAPDKLVVVLGANAKQIIESFNDDHQFVVNQEWDQGMGSSLVCGLIELLEMEPGLDVLVIALADMPLVSTQHFSKLIEGYKKSGKPIIATRYAETVGVPVLFHRSFFKELARLTGDEGAKKILKQHADKVHYVPSDEPYFDVDTPEAYSRLKSLN